MEQHFYQLQLETLTTVVVNGFVTEVIQMNFKWILRKLARILTVLYSCSCFKNKKYIQFS